MRGRHRIIFEEGGINHGFGFGFVVGRGAMIASSGRSSSSSSGIFWEDLTGRG